MYKLFAPYPAYNGRRLSKAAKNLNRGDKCVRDIWSARILAQAFLNKHPDTFALYVQTVPEGLVVDILTQDELKCS